MYGKSVFNDDLLTRAGFWIACCFSFIFGIFYLITPLPAFAADTYTDEIFNGRDGTSQNLSFGREGSNAIKRAFFYNPSIATWICDVTVQGGSNTGSPTADVNVSVYSGGANPDAGSLIVTLPFTLAQWANQTVDLNFPLCYSFTSSTPMWIVFSQQSDDGDGNFPTVVGENTTVGSFFSGTWVYTGSWSSNNLKAYMTVYGTTSTIATSQFAFPDLPVSSSSLTFVCPDLGFTATAICDAFVYLGFFDPDSFVAFASSTIDHLYYAAPFGYLTRFREAWEEHVTDVYSTTTAFTLSWTTPASPFAPTSTATLLDQNTIQNSLGSSTKNEIRDFTVLAMWLMFLLYLYERVTSFIDSFT